MVYPPYTSDKAIIFYNEMQLIDLDFFNRQQMVNGESMFSVPNISKDPYIKIQTEIFTLVTKPKNNYANEKALFFQEIKNPNFGNKSKDHVFLFNSTISINLSEPIGNLPFKFLEDLDAWIVETRHFLWRIFLIEWLLSRINYFPFLFENLEPQYKNKWARLRHRGLLSNVVLHNLKYSCHSVRSIPLFEHLGLDRSLYKTFGSFFHELYPRLPIWLQYNVVWKNHKFYYYRFVPNSH